MSMPFDWSSSHFFPTDANVNLEQGDIKEVTTSKEVTTETTHDFTFERVSQAIYRYDETITWYFNQS